MQTAIIGGITGGITIGITTVKAQPKLESSNISRPPSWRPFYHWSQ
jgi:hypothetical protein